MQLSYHFQNIVKISLSHFFWTISHDIYLISTYTESSYWCLLVKLFLDESGKKKSKYTPHKLSLTGKDKFPPKKLGWTYHYSNMIVVEAQVYKCIAVSEFRKRAQGSCNGMCHSRRWVFGSLPNSAVDKKYQNLFRNSFQASTGSS